MCGEPRRGAGQPVTGGLLTLAAFGMGARWGLFYGRKAVACTGYTAAYGCHARRRRRRGRAVAVTV
eukprot:scaffold133599_cov63-Phaeocystis_antarctica.AAC.1